MIAKFLGEQHISFELPVDFITGKSGKWRFNFILNHQQPETLVKAITATSSSQALGLAERSVFEVMDVKAVSKSEAVVIAGDEAERVEFWPPDVRRVFEANEVPFLRCHASRTDLLELAARYAVRS